MKEIVLYVLLLSQSFSTLAQNITSEQRYVHKDIMVFLNALHQIETSGKLGAIKGDGGKACGPFQIWEGYYQDAVEKSKGKLNKPYSSVSDIKYAREVVLWYFYRYESKALENGEWEILAKLHHLGPNWKARKALGDKYWVKVKKHLK